MDRKIKQLQAFLDQQSEIEFAIVFGSYAKETQRFDSDLDLAIQLGSGSTLTAKQKLEYVVQLGKILKIEIDLIDLKKVGQPLLSQIIKYGKVLKGSANQYAELAIRNINTTEDFLPYIKRMMSERRAYYFSNG